MKEENEVVMALKDLTVGMHALTFSILLFALTEELPEDFDFSLLSKLQKLSGQIINENCSITKLLSTAEELEEELPDYPASEKTKNIVLDCIRDFRKML